MDINKMDFHVALVRRATEGDKPDTQRDLFAYVLDGYRGTYEKGIGLRSIPYPGRGRRNELDRFWMYSVPKPPTAPEIIASLAGDAGCYADSLNLDDFAANFCEGMKPSEIMCTWNECRRAYEFFSERRLNLDDFREV